jgi:hypothetical protein
MPLTSPTSGSRLVSIDHWQTKVTEFSFVVVVTAYGFTWTWETTRLPVWCWSMFVISHHNMQCSSMEPLGRDSWYMRECPLWLHSLWLTNIPYIRWWQQLNLLLYNTCFCASFQHRNHYSCIPWLQSVYVQQGGKQNYVKNDTKVQFHHFIYEYTFRFLAATTSVI